MKGAAKFFIILSMICLFWCIIPLIVGILALKQIDTATQKSDLTGIGICTLIFCSFLGGIFMLCISEADLRNNRKPIADQQ